VIKTTVAAVAIPIWNSYVELGSFSFDHPSLGMMLRQSCVSLVDELYDCNTHQLARMLSEYATQWSSWVWKRAGAVVSGCGCWWCKYVGSQLRDAFMVVGPGSCSCSCCRWQSHHTVVDAWMLHCACGICKTFLQLDLNMLLFTALCCCKPTDISGENVQKTRQ